MLQKNGVNSFLLHMKHASLHYELHIRNKSKCFCLSSRMKDFTENNVNLLSVYAIAIYLVIYQNIFMLQNCKTILCNVRNSSRLHDGIPIS